MQNIIIAVVIFFGGWWLFKQFGMSSPSQSGKLIRKMGGMACIGLAGLITLRGNVNAAIPLFVFGLGLMGTSMDNFGFGKKSSGQKSKVQTSLLVMELDHDTGKMDGKVIAGLFKGRLLSSLADSELKTFHSACAAAGDQSLALLQAWLDRAKPEWREAWQGARSAPAQRGGAMGRDEALAVLGLKKGAGSDDIRAAHKRLMKEFHPDKGGSDYLASKINEAKDVLLQD
jgi:DnaJ domain